MNRAIVKGFVTAGLLVMAIVAAGVSAQAQSLQYKLTANIPFEFKVADQKLPAGKYSVRRAMESSGDMVVRISGVDNDAIASRVSIPLVTYKPKRQGTLIFHRYGEEYFLSEVWPASSTTGRAFLKTREERDLERNAQNNVVGAVRKTTKPEIVTVIAELQ